MEKLTYKKELTRGKKDVNIIKDQAKKENKTEWEKTFKNFFKKVLTFFDKRGNII